MLARDPSPLYPLRFQPVLKDYVWGGRELARLGRVLPDGPIAESWEISDHPHGQTVVEGGALDGATLGDLVASHGPALVGDRNARALERGRFPLLIKLLDAREWLSVQVHPSDRQAGEHAGDLGKTEMWIVLGAEPDAEIILGFAKPTSRREFKAALEAGELEALLHRVPARAGDVFFVPAGTLHAIGPGLLLAEIQQTSDVTYRVHDWGRDGPSRELHVDEALEVIDFSIVRPGAVEPVGVEESPTERELLASCPYFRTERVRLHGSAYRGRCDHSTFEIWALFTGSAELSSSAGEVSLEPVSWLLLPADLGNFEVRSGTDAELVRVLTPRP
ncbi:MAG: type I phosphomannose isomerase catalytic subunit [Thermoanaerobaculia bacterium]